jgi:hypothetical protein
MMTAATRWKWLSLPALVPICLLAATCGAVAQPAPPAPPPTPVPPPPPAPPLPPPEEGGFTTRDTSVGYIDSALPASQIALRYTAGYRFDFPNRAEFFYARPQPLGPGLPLPERSIDFQEITAILEAAGGPRWSAFLELPVRFLNPEVNDNAAGLGDLDAGFKYAFWLDCSGVATFQLRAYAPSGDPHRGLGTNHASLEPALLLYKPLAERLGFVGELRYWVPLGGTDFAGDVIRYGIGLRYDLVQTESLRLAPVIEAIGWTVLSGKQSRLMPDGTVSLDDATGVSVVNLKLGYRLDVGERFGMYAGYGRALTGDRWYSDIVRVEMRWLY